MTNKIRFSVQWTLPIIIGVCLLALFVSVRPAHAITQIPTPDPKPGSFGLEATKPQPPPKVGATITTPGDGSSFTTSPITVNGICPKGLLVEIYDNDVMAGSVMCTNGSFSLKVSLFAGTNVLKAIVYDDIGQAGPTSNTRKVTYHNAQFTSFGALVTLTSSYGRRSAGVGNELGWPLQVSGGSGPYALNIDWGDGKSPQLKSQASAGSLAIAHTYDKAGVYQVNVTVADAHGVNAFLQVVAIASGQVDASASAGDDGSSKTPATVVKVPWVSTAVSFALLLPTFWLGRLSQVASLRKKMLKERDGYKK